MHFEHQDTALPELDKLRRAAGDDIKASRVYEAELALRCLAPDELEPWPGEEGYARSAAYWRRTDGRDQEAWLDVLVYDHERPAIRAELERRRAMDPVDPLAGC